ncbi:uncharacterized protein [Epargyreus clarus]|uniref:uncharacterized protein n=1 Tax=Epargyreus clarus TaxID=520877 RepID=UPI003C2FD6CB
MIPPELSIIFTIFIQDTNNHSPIFKPTDVYDFSLALPVPPGFLVTGCDKLIVRDVDLTTKRIDFEMEDNPYFEIAYYDQIQSKEFGAIIKTKTLIRSLPDTLSLAITATDVDLTGDEPRTSRATVNIQADNMFTLPEEPIFSQAFYTADYTADHNIILRENILLQQGYDDQVQFDFDGEYADNFELIVNGNLLSFRVTKHLPEDVSQDQLLLVVRATRPYTSGATATVVIIPPKGKLSPEFEVLSGSLENNVLTLDTIVLTTGYDEDVEYSLSGEIFCFPEFATYFTLSNIQNRVTISVRTEVPENVILENSALLLTLSASGLNAITATTNILLDVIKDDHITPVFEKAVYSGSYDTVSGLALEDIVIIQGYDDTVEVSLVGDHADLFTKRQEGGTVSLSGTIPAEIWPEQNLFLTLQATKPRTVGANTVIQISLPSEITSDLILGFEQVSYSGTIEDNTLSLEPIILVEGFTEQVSFALLGDLASYFSLARDGPTVRISLRSAIPEDIIPTNRIVILALRASGPQALPAFATVVLAVERTETAVEQLAFAETYYTGLYTEQAGLNFEQHFSLARGYDDTVEFALVGEHSAWFGLDRRSENSIALTLLSPIPSAVLANNQKLIFIIEATRPNSDVVARATVVISLIDEITSDLILGFEQVSYSGTIEDNTLSLEPIILVEGFTEQVSFALLGDLAPYFSLARDGPTVRISLRSAIPEDIIPTNRIVILALRASGPQALPAFATIVLAVERTETAVEQLAFAETYYTGLYTEQAGLNFEQHFSLARGYDDTVEFALVGEHSAWFGLDRRSENSIALTLLSPIPSAVLANNQKLIFIIEATRPNSDVVARATVVISLIDEITSDLILGFEQVSYSGTIEDNTLSLEPIILVEGFTEQVSFALLGDLASYFSLARDGPTVRISLRSAIPEDIIPTNRIVILALRASGPQALPAFATIVLAVERTETAVEQLAFAETYYTGLYTEQAGLNFEQHFSLARGYDDTVEFALVGEHSAWFGLDRRSENSIALTLLSPIPSAVLANNQKLIFIIEATRPNSDVVARATVVISLIDEITSDLILGFEQVSYSGTIEDNTLSLEPIILVEGFTEQVSFALLGDLASYFSLARDGPTVRISLRSAIPEDIIPTNRIVILALRASGPQALPAFATIVLAVERTETAVEQLAFAETYYTGLYTEQAGLNFEQHFSLARGYDDTVEFALVGEHSAWFGLDRRSENSIALTLLSPIPSAVLANNQKLIFIIEATRPNSDVVARATVVISLIDEITSDLILGFEQVSYSGTIEDNTLSLEPIILVEGFTEQVSFALLGDLAPFFSLARDGPTVRISLRSAIPEDIIPTNRIVILALRASGPQALPAFATIVLAVERTETAVEQLAFAETYYTGLYTEQAGLNFEQHFSLARGYDDTVEFALVGEHSAWFGLDRRSENSIALTLLSPIPSAVLANNQKLIFIIEATRPNSDVVARATVVISLIDEITSDLILGFEQVSYSGTIEDNTLSLEPIILVEGFTEQVSFALLGDLASYFSLARDGPTVRISLRSAIPEDIIPTNRIVILALRASGPQALPAFATIVLAVERTETAVEQLAFAETYYTGLYTEQAGLNFEQHFSLARGYDDTVEFALVGEHSAWFGLDRRSENSIALTLLSPIPSAVLANNQKLIFIIEATRPNSDVVARATVVISLIDEITSDLILGFEQVSYSGTIEDNTLSLEPIILVEGFTEQVSFALLGDLASYFSLARDGPTVRISLRSAIPEDIIPTNRIVILALRASGPQALPAFATIVLAVERTETAVEQLAFAETYYTGLYTEQAGLNFEQHFSLARGYDDTVEFALVGEHSAWFGLDRRSENSIALTLLSPIPSAVLANNQKLIFIIEATRPNSDVVARATVVISLIDEITSDLILGFEQVSYSGTIEDNTLSLEPIILVEGFTEQVSFALLGDLAPFFSLARDGPTVRISLRSAIPEDIIPTNRIVILALRASGPQALPAFATIVLAVERTETAVEQLAFAETYYTGLYTEQAGLNFEQHFSLARGYDDTVEFALVGEHSAWFGLARRSENSIALTLLSPIPSAVLANNQKLIFIIEATRPNSDVLARATVVISLIDDADLEPKVYFDNVLYNGVMRLGNLIHEQITISGYEGSTIEILGQYAELFEAVLSDVNVVITSKPSAVLPEISHIALELRAGRAQAVLVIDITESETPVLPTVTFDSSSYVLQVDDSRTGLVGLVQATSDNGESIIYTLRIDNEHLQQRLTVNSGGELRLSAPVTIGEYSFIVVATTRITQVSATAPVSLTVEAATARDDIDVPPLIILDRDEEEPHRNLVLLNETRYDGCKFALSNSWPENQSWLYVDSYGLHALSIDREDESIAFMALSQIQVELILECEGDVISRAKRSVSSNSRTDWLGPYDYGSNKWILTDAIPYNARRSLVNLIVNDINDNTPIFVDKAKEPVAVGYPIAELEDIILPRSLAELKATDADVGENAALVYWSSHDSLAVSPTTGFVHVRNGFNLENDARLVVHATDRNGDGLTGDLELVVKLLEINKIAVVTIRNAFLNDEEKILNDLTKAVGYEIKTLRTVVISEAESSRTKRDTTDTSGATLQLFVYGLIEREPVEVNQLTTDISNNNIATVNVASSVPLEDHLVDHQGQGRDTGLLAATIALSVLLFILIVAIAVWYFLKWRNKKLYKRFSDKSSLASRSESVEQPKQDNVAKPRLNIEDLKRSERKLQERLQVPIVDVTVEPTTSTEQSADAIINMPTPEPQSPIIIQTIDKLKDNTEESEDDDEFGEKKKSRRKSVVTFNENVEKIIHIEDTPDTIPTDDYEVYKL